MISCYLSGGLGNQLFQIFATIAYCIQHDKSFLFPRQKTYLKETNRPTYWDEFLYGLSKYTSPDETALLAYHKYNEPQHTYTSIPREIEGGENGNAMLKGFFQSPKYFENQYHQILEMSGVVYLRANVLFECGLFGSPQKHTISMHFRMGDYKGIRCYHPVMSPRYYADALNVIIKQKQLETTEVAVYCFFEEEDRDEIDKYIQSILPDIKGEKVEWVKIGAQYSDWKQMLIMSGCDDHIIANSTFSWWSAYMNPSPHKIVCYPDAWYGHQLYYIDVRDMFPENWTRIETDKGYYSSWCFCRK